jgi:AcrR family transcriptional regulator
VIAAALALIRAQGPDVTMDEVAEAAGVSKPIVYRNLGDKDALVVALSEIFVDRLNEVVELAVAASPPGRASFAAAVRATLELIDEDRNLFTFVNAGGPGTDNVQRLVERSSATMIGQFTAMRTAVGLDPGPARTWAYATVGAFQIVAMMWLRDGYRSPDDVTDDLTELMWPGITGGGTAARRRP